jgi:hypothetical protein
MDYPKMSRRNFNKSVAMGAASLAMSAGPAVRSVLGANDRIGVGLIGSGGQGSYNLRSFVKTGQVDVVALADVNDLPLNNALASLNLKVVIKTFGSLEIMELMR